MRTLVCLARWLLMLSASTSTTIGLLVDLTPTDRPALALPWPCLSWTISRRHLLQNDKTEYHQRLSGFLQCQLSGSTKLEVYSTRVEADRSPIIFCCFSRSTSLSRTFDIYHCCADRNQIYTSVENREPDPSRTTTGRNQNLRSANRSSGLSPNKIDMSAMGGVAVNGLR